MLGINVLQVGIATAAAGEVDLEAEHINVAQFDGHLHDVIRRAALVNAREKQL